MTRLKNIILSAAVLLIAVNVHTSAQTVTSNTVGYIHKGADVNFMKIAEYEKTHPKPAVRKLPFDEAEESGAHPPHPLADPALVHLYVPETNGAENPHFAYLPVSPTPADTFLGKTSNFTSIPPDTHGAVDSLYAVTAINSSVTIENRYTHAVVSSVTIDAFWASMETHGTSGAAYDPRVHYDPYYKRWIMVADCYGQSANSQIMIAVSATGNPTGSWHMYALPVGSSSGTGQWLDFPCVGFNNRWIAVSGNFFQVTGTGSFISDVLYVFDYASLMSGAAMGAYGTLTPSNSFCICPAQTLDPAESNMFCLESWNPNAGQLQLYKISGSIGSLTLGVVGNPSTSNHWQQSNNGDDFVPQLGGSTSYLLQANDDRINNVYQRNGKIWCAHTAFLPATGTPTRVSALWWQIDSNATPAQVGLIDDNTGVNYYWFPSVAVNANDDALIGFATSSLNIHPSCGYSLHLHTDAASSWRPIYTYRHGQQIYFQTFGAVSVSTPGYQDRWGDYSGTCVDPINNLDFFTIQESVPNYTGGIANSIWDTWWAHVRVCGTVAAPATVASPATQCQGTSAWYSAAAVAGATGYTWTVSGTGWTYTTSAATDSIDLTASTSAGTVVVTVAANDSCGPGPAYSFTVTPQAIPNEVITTPDSICVGATSAVFNATATGSPTSYNWSVVGTGWSGSSTTSSLTATIGTGTGLIIVNAVNGCGTGPNDTLSVTPGTAPGAATAINSTASVYCIGSTDVLTTPAVSGATSYIWSVTGTGWSGTSTTNSINVTIGTGTGTITVTPVNACGDGTPYTLTGIVPVTAPIPTFSESTTITNVNDTVYITYLGSVTSGSTFTWTFNTGIGAPGTGSGVQTVYWTTPGTYTVTLTVDNGGCVGTYTDTVQVDPATSVQKVAAVPTFNANIIPNPNDGSFNIIFDQPATRPVSVKISDMEGHTVYSNDFGAINGTKLPIVTEHLASGNYNATIFVDGASITKQVTIVGK